jgi:dienelactone hydrolase
VRAVRALLALAALALAAMPALALPPPAPPSFAGKPIPLGTGAVPGGHSEEIWNHTGGRQKLWTARNVTEAVLIPVLPPAGKATGAGVVVAPGGAFRTLAMDSEGYVIAKWLADHGIAAFVLKYRLVPTAPNPSQFIREFSEVMKGAPAGPGERRKVPIPQFAIDDGIAAVRLVRTRAKEFGVDPARVGMMGFSAGAVTTIRVALQANPDSMPAFIAPVYPSMDPVQAPEAAPPMFAVMATDDGLYGRQGYGLIESWAQTGKKVEFHAFQRGGHGFGGGKPGTTSDGWLELFRRWLDMNGFLGKTS